MQGFAHDPLGESCLGEILAFMPSGPSDITRHDTTLELKEQDLIEMLKPPAVPPDTTLKLRENDLLEVHALPPAVPPSARHELPWQPCQPEEQQIDLEILEDEQRYLRQERRRLARGVALITAVPLTVIGALVLLALASPDPAGARGSTISTHGTLKLVDGEGAGEVSIHVSGPVKALAPRHPRRPLAATKVQTARRRRVVDPGGAERRARQRAAQLRLRQGQRQRHVRHVRLVRLGGQAIRSKKWRQARAHARLALRLEPKDRRARAMKRLAERRLARHQRRIALARRAERRRQWSSARTHAVLALRVYPGEQNALAIKRRAEGNLRRHRRHLNLAKRAARHRQWSRARARAIRALRIAPRDRRARAIKRLAERHLRQTRRYL
jgi:hypothetical protein